MDSIESVRVIEYLDEVIVDLQGTEEHGVIDVVSYQFSYEDEERAISPKGSGDEDHATIINETLTDEGFHWQQDTTDSEHH